MTFYFSKILWLLINPFNILILSVTLGILLNLFYKKNIYKFFYLFSVILFFLIGIMPTGEFMYYKLENSFHNQTKLPKKIDGILILSGATNPFLTKEHNQISLNDSVERLIESIYLIKNYPNAKVIFSGGSGSINNQVYTHSEVAKEFFISFQINPKKILFESKSRNTYENIIFSKKIANPKFNEKWLIVTSAFHMMRALKIGEKEDWNFLPYAVDFKTSKKFEWKPTLNFLHNMNVTQSASHELLGLVAYYLLGRTNKIF